MKYIDNIEYICDNSVDLEYCIAMFFLEATALDNIKKIKVKNKIKDF
jgi:hypothetical protein